MVRLFAVRVSIAALRLAIKISARLRPKTWKFLSILQVSVLIVSCWGFHVSTSHSVVRRASYTAAWSSSNADREALEQEMLAVIQAYKTETDLDLYIVDGSEMAASHRVNWSTPSDFGIFSLAAHGSAYTLHSEAFSSSRARFGSVANYPWDFWKPFKQIPIVIDVPSIEGNNYKKNITFWMSLFGMIVSPITSLATIIFAWISLRRKRAEELLMRLEVQKRELEIEKLRLDLEQARREYEESNASSPKIILLS